MHRSRLLPAAAAAVLLASCGEAPQPTATLDGPSLARSAVQRERVVVVFQNNVADAPGLARALANQVGGDLHFTYTTALKGMALSLPPAAIEALRRNPNVAYVEPDLEVTLFDAGTQTNATWGLDRVDQRDRPLNGTYSYANDGSGTNVYIFDTGVRRTHVDFRKTDLTSRVQYVPGGASGNTAGNFVGDTYANAEDCNGHGTHVAGTAAGNIWGVAKNAPIWAARVVNCNGGGQVSMAIAAVDWVTANGVKPAVINMSLGYGDVQSLRTAVETSIAAGYNYAVAAGNGDFLGRPQDACKQSPAGAPNAITVGSTTSTDTESSFSNFGLCVDLLAPGSAITSAWHTGDNVTNTISGTSMATPHVAGAVALYLTANPSASPAQVSQALVNNASVNKITRHSRSVNGGTPNLLLYTAFLGSTGGGNQPPTAAFSSNCSGLTCTFNASASTDPDGTIANYAWSFGDGSSGTGVSTSRTYTTGATYQVTLTVTDNGGASASTSQSVTVSAPGSGIELQVSVSKSRGVSTAQLNWSGTTGSVNVWRNGTVVETTSGLSFTDDLGRGGGTATYQVCVAGTSTCSNIAQVTY
jgi:serine protease